MMESVKWVLFHEFAHQLYDDFGEATQKERQEREARADKYASLATPNPPETPAAAVDTILLFCSLENFDVNNSGDHPAGLRRYRAMMDVTRSSPQWQKTLNLATPAQRQVLEEALDRIDKMTDTPPKD